MNEVILVHLPKAVMDAYGIKENDKVIETIEYIFKTNEGNQTG